jgi:hypothetical protein
LPIQTLFLIEERKMLDNTDHNCHGYKTFIFFATNVPVEKACFVPASLVNVCTSQGVKKFHNIGPA